jgi:hypothetical protein
MREQSIILKCPNCKETFRTKQEAQHGAKMRCPGCQGMFYFVLHGNGAVEMRPLKDEPAIESRLPPRVGDPGEPRAPRRIFAGRRRNRPIGGYAPFEKSRSYTGMFAFFTILGLVGLAASWYMWQIDRVARATGKSGGNIWQSADDGKRKDFQARQKRALENLKKQQAKGQPAGRKLEDGRLPGLFSLCSPTPANLNPTRLAGNDRPDRGG